MLSYEDFVLGALTEEGLVTPESIDRARVSEPDRSVLDALIDLEILTPRQLTMARASVCECPYADLSQFDVDLSNARLIPRSVARKFDAFPLFVLEGLTTVGMVDPMDLQGVDRLRSLLRSDIDPVICEPTALRALIERAYSLVGAHGTIEDDEPKPDSADPATDAVLGTDDEPIVAAVNQIISEGVSAGASDIHIGPDEHELHLRYRIDGTLRCMQGPPLSSHSGIVQRIKVMANLDLTQTRRPQDGKFRYVCDGRSIDIRLSVLPTIWGENIVMRLLGAGLAVTGFAELGCSPQTVSLLEHATSQPYGMILATGPTGSGKTTTLYTALALVNTPDRNLVTIEDPVEYRLPMVRHVQVNTEIGLGFASALRAILRQDPDVILLGEIRDEETARIAIQAAMTGHLVLSTLHTNNAPGAIARLRDLECPSFAINASVLCVLAQRLARRNCEQCASPYEPTPALVRRFLGKDDSHQFLRGRGCPKCMNQGTKGRVGVYEALSLTPALQEAIESHASSGAITEIALREGMTPMWRDGVEKAKLGIIELEEVARIAAGSLEPGLDDGRKEAA